MKSYQKDGHLVRPASTFRSFISRERDAKHPPEADRYALYVSPGCPWAHRTLIVRHLKGLESLIDVIQVSMHMGPDGWYFSAEGGSPPEDPLHPGFTKLKQLYEHADPDYKGRYTVSVAFFIWSCPRSTYSVGLHDQICGGCLCREPYTDS